MCQRITPDCVSSPSASDLVILAPSLGMKNLEKKLNCIIPKGKFILLPLGQCQGPWFKDSSERLSPEIRSPIPLLTKPVFAKLDCASVPVVSAIDENDSDSFISFNFRPKIY